jgi:hypothetical protein
MASIDASTSGAGGIITTADNTGTLNIQSGGTTIATISSTGLAVASGKTLSVNGTTVPSNIPAFSAYNNANQTLNNNTSYKVLFQVEEFDTNSNFASSRFTPTVAGYYQINAQVLIENNSNAGTLLCQVFKNGADYKSTQSTVRSGSNTTALCCGVIYFNGSTDYLEIYALQATGATATLIANSFLSTWINGAFVRSA